MTAKTKLPLISFLINNTEIDSVGDFFSWKDENTSFENHSVPHKTDKLPIQSVNKGSILKIQSNHPIFRIQASVFVPINPFRVEIASRKVERAKESGANTQELLDILTENTRKTFICHLPSLSNEEILFHGDFKKGRIYECLVTLEFKNSKGEGICHRRFPFRIM